MVDNNEQISMDNLYPITSNNSCLFSIAIEIPIDVPLLKEDDEPIINDEEITPPPTDHVSSSVTHTAEFQFGLIDDRNNCGDEYARLRVLTILNHIHQETILSQANKPMNYQPSPEQHLLQSIAPIIIGYY